MASIQQVLKSPKWGYVAQKGKFSLYKVPKQKFITYQSKGDPYNNHEFSQAVADLVEVSREISLALTRGKSENIMPLECLWYSNQAYEFEYRQKDNWHWRLMIRQSDKLTNSTFKKVLGKKKKIKFESFTEGLSVQTVHVGPDLTERPTFSNLLKYILKEGFAPNGPLHEIYLSDPTKTRPDDLLTIVRRPIKKRKR